MADDANDMYAIVAQRFGIPSINVPRMRAIAPSPPPPEPPRQSYEGVTLAQATGMVPPPAPAGPPAPPRASYEGVSLADLAPPARPGFALAEPPRQVVGAPPPKASMPMMQGANVSPPVATMKPSVARQVDTVAKNSEAAQKQVKESLDENERKANLEGATFYDPAQGGMQNPYGRGGLQLIDPGGRRTASWQIQQGLDLGIPASEAVGSADERQRTAAGLDYMAGQKAADFERGYLERHAQASDKFAAEESARVQKYTGQVADHMANLDDLRQQIREFKVDPFGGMNPTIARIGQAVAIGLGAFASQRGENQGLDAIKHAISTNVQVQEKELEKLERGAKGETNFMSQLKQAFGDTKVASEAAYIAYLDRSKVELAKQLGSPEVADPRLLAAYERLQGKLDDELVERTARFKQLTEDRVIRHDVNAQPRYAGGAATTEAKHDARYLSEAFEKAGLPASLSELKDVDRVIDSFGDGDIPGVGPIQGKIPSMLLGDRAVAGRQAVQSIKNAIGHARFGGALSPIEAEKLDNQLDGAKDAASLRRTVQALRQSLQHRAANIAAGASPAGVSLYEERGGSVQQGAPTGRQISPSKSSTPHIKEAK